MKTKIIYISGGEIFDMADIRDALDQVRDALGLNSDTVLFGVPVDKSDALTDHVTSKIESVTVVANTTPVDNEAPEIMLQSPAPVIDVVESEPDENIKPIDAPIEIQTTDNVAPVKKSRGRPKSAKKVAEKSTDNADTGITTPDTVDTTNTDKVVSILSVLTAKTTDTTVSDDVESTTVTELVTEPIVDTVPEITEFTETTELPVDDITDDVVDVAPVDEETQPTSIDDMIASDAPVAPQEKTLEQLLESMAPLREDIEHEHHIEQSNDIADDVVADDTTDTIDMSADDDATLEQLATEFAENQDKIATMPKTENHGKIGKLKNILPFKKARRDDTGLMGDLFGWAGVAANDEDFAIPGFFTNAASKK